MSEDKNSPFTNIFLGILLGALIVGATVVFYKVLQPPVIERVEWNYPVEPFHFTNSDPPDGALHYSTSKKATTSEGYNYYDVYVWKINFVGGQSELYWTYRLVSSP